MVEGDIILTEEQKEAYEDAIKKEEDKNLKEKITKNSSKCQEILENKNEAFDEFEINDCLHLGKFLCSQLLSLVKYCKNLNYLECSNFSKQIYFKNSIKIQRKANNQIKKN